MAKTVPATVVAGADVKGFKGAYNEVLSTEIVFQWFET